MCGIAGSYGQKVDKVQTTLDILEHRGPDGYGVKHLVNGTLGHTRLAIIDIIGGEQPLVSDDRQTWMVCNGEIYNYRQLRADLDYPFQTDSDNEVILALFQKHGTRTAEHLDGMFAFALVDDDTFYMARDPLGIKPLYYGWDGETIHFGSEIKAIQDKVTEIMEFPPGYWYSNKDGFVRYYDLAQVNEDAITQSKTAPPSLDDIQASLRRAVKKRLMADVPVGVYLSGGLDSTIVASLVAQEIDDVHSFAVGVEGSEDIKHARLAAKALGTQHHECIYTMDEMIEALPDVIYHLESFDPLLVRSSIPNYFLARLTRKYVTVVLTGEGADELYAGYHYLKEFNDTDLREELLKLTGTLYNCNLQRCDRMTMAHSIEGRVPFLDTDFIKLSFSVPLEQKIYGEKAIEKWALRKAFEGMIPPEVAWRYKEQFSKGAGSSHLFEEMAEREIGDAEFKQACADILEETGIDITTKETLLYYREFIKHFGKNAASLVQLWAGKDVA